jgi:hypothetical protein
VHGLPWAEVWVWSMMEMVVPVSTLAVHALLECSGGVGGIRWKACYGRRWCRGLMPSAVWDEVGGMVYCPVSAEAAAAMRSCSDVMLQRACYGW